jgi:hypothetical protein
MPDPTKLLQVIAGEFVFGLEIDSRIRQAANGMTALLMIELFKRCDEGKANWPVEFADGLSELGMGDPSVLVGFDDGRSEGREAEDGDFEASESPSEHYLKLRFTDEDAAYYQFHLYPAFDEPFITAVQRKREGDLQHIRIELSHPDKLQLFIQGLRHNPHLVSVDASSEEVFAAAASQAV